MTKPVKLNGKALRLNAKSDFGEIVVELLDSAGKLLVRSKPIQRDGLDIPVEWSGDIEQHGEPVSLRIKLKNARLFAMWCGR